MKTVIWSPMARKSLATTVEFVELSWNEKIKEQFLNQLDFRISQIQTYSELAPAFENSDIRRLIILSEFPRLDQIALSLGQPPKSC